MGNGKESESEAAGKLNNLLEVVKHLKRLGWKISKSAIYRHRDEGKIRPHADGGFFVKDVEKYARDFLQQRDGSGRRTAVGPVALHDKKNAEARKVAAQAEHWEIKTKILRGEYIERSAFERALARRAAVFKSDIENFIRTHCGEMISIVKGDSVYLPDLTDFWLDQSEKWLGRYSEAAEFEIPAAVDIGRLETMEG